MGVEQQQNKRPTTPDPVCEGFVEKKKSDHRRIPIGPSWKRRYCSLSSDGLRLFQSKQDYMCGAPELRIIPMCHIKSARSVQHHQDQGQANLAYFDVETERGEVTSFRFRDKVAWSALIEIELIRYKNKQDMARYKRMYRNQSNYDVNGSCQCKPRPVPPITSTAAQPQHFYDPIGPIKAKQGLKTIVLPNQKNGGLGIGITVIPLDDGRVVVNRLLQGGPAVRHGEILPGDEIVSANGKLVTDITQLTSLVRQSSSVRLLVKTTHLSIHPASGDLAALENLVQGSPDPTRPPRFHETDIATRIAFEKGLIRPVREVKMPSL